ncbi:NADP-dependent malic enzyme [Magnetovirga frankeli]|uniref:NADP-dependent malic enzyme n=1 Tax=Magnetovirga frankeli TaxID=947516 RepID=UPI00129379A9|nr:NADP-dependent malic enzyme [gamma proteobacterium SS-5]
MTTDLKQAALHYHRHPSPGKLEIRATKPLASQRDLALAYSPGVAHACEAIVENPLAAAEMTARGNLVAVISNGTAVLGLGAIGALAGKPVMEGKAVLFKKFAGIDVFDIEIDERDPQAFIDTVARLEPTFGGINLEDIKAPECFIIEEGLKQRMQIPVFHDDQHGTAIVVSAAILNGLEIVGKPLDQVRLVTAGAGAAALACLDLLVELGLNPANITVTDIAGVVYAGRSEEMDPYKARYARDTEQRSLQQALAGADVFLGLSAAGVLKAEWLPAMAERPLILALANPNPEIDPAAAKAVRPDAILATGRSDYANQVNNVLCFPFLFRGALDVGAREINSAMKLAAVRAIAGLARQQPSDVVRAAYGGQLHQFGPDYLIPKPFDPRLMEQVPLAVAQAAMESGAASRPRDLADYRAELQSRVFRTSLTMRPVFEQARANPRRVLFAEGAEEKVLQACQQALELGLAQPMLLGNRSLIESRIAALGLDLKDRLEIIDPADCAEFETYLQTYYQRVARSGLSPAEARETLRHSATAFAATLLQSGRADALICGSVGRYNQHLAQIEQIIGLAPGVARLTSLSGLVMDSGSLFFADTYVQQDPDAEALLEILRLSAGAVRAFGLEPRVALLSHSNFGSHDSASAQKMRRVLELTRAQLPELQIEGEMHADLALSEALRQQRFPLGQLRGSANLLLMPNQDAANIAFNLLKVVADGIAIGPLLLGTARSAHIVTPSITVRGLLNMTALAAVRA